MATGSYDAVLYPARPFVQTHPDRLATLGTLFGLSPAAPAGCRVLELGCGVGGNLLPMAATMPEATFVGIDNAAVPIARARALAERLGLTNVRFHVVGIEDYEAPAEGFDYVLAHGVYSWVPEPVRDALLALCGRTLSSDGIAYVSYNALPGGHLRRMLREALAVGVGEIEEPVERIAAAREFLALLIAAAAADDELAPTLARAAREVIGNDDAFLFHDVLSEDNVPFSVGEFVADARAYGLQYLSEAQFSETQIDAMPEPVQEALRAIGDPLRRETQLDLFKERRFRQTLLCRADRSLAAEPAPERLVGMAVSGTLRWSADGDHVTFLGPGTARVATDHPLVVRTLKAIAAAWPSPVWIADLGTERELPALRGMLLQCYAANLVRLHVHPPFVATEVPERPLVSALARVEAQEGTMLTTARHTHVEIGDELTRRVVALLDGTRDRAGLSAALTGEASAAGIDASLATLAGQGMLL